MSRQNLVFLVLSVLGILASQSVSSQTVNPPEIEWERTFGGIGQHISTSALVTRNGDYVCIGVYGSEDMGNVYIIRVNTSGEKLWEKYIGTSGAVEIAYSITETQDNGFITTGSNSQTPPMGSNRDISVIRIDNMGNQIWSKSYGIPEYDERATFIIKTSDNNYLITGRKEVGPDRAFLLKIDSEGNVLWEKTFGGENTSCGNMVLETDDPGYMMVGFISSSVRDVDWEHMYIVKTNVSGETEWEKYISFPGFEIFGQGITRITDGNYVIVGSAVSDALNGKIYLCKIDTIGEKIWEKFFGDTGYNTGHRAQETRDGGIVIAGYKPVLNKNSYVTNIIKTDSLGNLIWEKSFDNFMPAPGMPGPYIEQTNDGGFIVAQTKWLQIPPYGYEINLVKLAPDPPPSPPNNFSASLRTPQSAGISWVDNALNETSFILERKLVDLGAGGQGSGGAEEWTQIGEVPANTMMFIDPVLPPNNEATYRIAARNANGISSKVLSQPITTPDSRWQLKIYDSATGKWVDLKKSSQFNPDWGTAVIVHGWQPFGQAGNALDNWMKDVAKAIQKRKSNTNIIGWEWIKEATGRNPTEGSKPVYDQIEQLSKLLKEIIPEDYNKPLHFMGHSFGSYIVARVCKKFLGLVPKNPREFPQVQVTLFDPADVGLLFNLTTEVNLLRANKIYTDMYHGFSSVGIHNVNLWVNVPCISV